VCGNGNLPGTATGVEQLDKDSADQLGNRTMRWCTKFNVPNPDVPGSEAYSKQHFARMWYDLLFASDSLLSITQGQDDPYSWTTGAGCGYTLGGGRYSYTNQSEQDILHNASRLVYNIDEGVQLGSVDRSLLIGGATPAVGEYNFENPLRKATVLQTLYATLVPKDIQNRIMHCKRPSGPVELSLEDTEEMLQMWKAAMEDSWNKGWDDDNDGEVQFVSFFDDSGGVIGSTGRMLNDITLDNNKLMVISFVIIALFSAVFLVSYDIIESRVLLTTAGVALVILGYFAGVGLALLLNIKVRYPTWPSPLDKKCFLTYDGLLSCVLPSTDQRGT
jgi:hypothetical protein